MTRRFCFYSGYRDLKGGYTTLLLTLITELRNQEQEVVLINYHNGLIEKELALDNIKITILDLDAIIWKDIHQKIFSTDIFIITAFDEIYRHIISINPVIIFYDINDFISGISDYKFGIKFPSLGRKLIRQLQTNRSLWFMDDTGMFNLANDFDLQIEKPVFVPIPVIVPRGNSYMNRKSHSTEVLQLTYIGRSVDWKMKPLKKILSDIVEVKSLKEILFTVVVDDARAMKEMIELDRFGGVSNFTLKIMENLNPSDINEFLMQYSDLHFAMGTAALDAAKLGIPTIVMDYSPKELPGDYTYSWLFEVKDFSLGKNLLKRSALPGLSMKELLDKVNSDPLFIPQVSSLSHDYVLKAHDVKNIVNEIIKLSTKAGFRLKEASKYIPYYFRAHRLIKAIAGALYSNKSTR